MKKNIILSLLLLSTSIIFSQEKFALIIGNSKYQELSQLENPTNDANDISDALKELGFTVKLLLNASLNDFENSVTNFKRDLSSSKENVGFFYYAGHGIQHQGENYLIPSDSRIPSESYLKSRTFPVNILMDELNLAGNELNMIVLDACRNNPFGWSRSTSRGLTVIGNRPAGSIVVYATSEGSVASDGEGRNGLFTSELLKHINKPNIDVDKIFKLTGKGVQERSNSKQIPAIYNKYFGEKYLNTLKEEEKLGYIRILVENEGELYIDNKFEKNLTNNSKILKEVPLGAYSLKYISNGEIEIDSVLVAQDEVTVVSFKGSIDLLPPKDNKETVSKEIKYIENELDILYKKRDRVLNERKPYILTSNLSFGLSGISFVIGGSSYSSATNTLDEYKSETNSVKVESLREQFTGEYNSTQLGLAIGGSSLLVGISSRLLAPKISLIQSDIKDLEMKLGMLRYKEANNDSTAKTTKSKINALILGIFVSILGDFGQSSISLHTQTV